jgi:hypothetical protein
MNSMAPVLGVRGHAGLFFKPTDDKIIDACGPTPAIYTTDIRGGVAPGRWCPACPRTRFRT